VELPEAAISSGDEAWLFAALRAALRGGEVIPSWAVRP
jgi:hypothetical protein